MNEISQGCHKFYNIGELNYCVLSKDAKMFKNVQQREQKHA
jgi:hypothetical protein